VVRDSQVKRSGLGHHHDRSVKVDEFQWCKNRRYKVSFGEAVDIDGDVAVVGASAYRLGDVSAYVFRRIRAKWFEEGKLLPDGSYLNDFGMVLSIMAVWKELKRYFIC